MAEKNKFAWLLSLFSGRRGGVKKTSGKRQDAKPVKKEKHVHSRPQKKSDSPARPGRGAEMKAPEPHSVHTDSKTEGGGFSLFGKRKDPMVFHRPKGMGGKASDGTGSPEKEVVKEFIASDVMSRKVTSIRTDDSLDYVLRLFSEKSISGAPVVNRTGNLVGTLSETDLSQYVGSKDLIDAQTNRLDELKEKKVQEIMKRNVITVYEHTPLHEINYEMNKHDIARVIVIDHKRQVVGIVTRADMVNGIAKEMLSRVMHKSREFEKSQISTDVDEVLETVDKRGVVSIAEISKKLGVPEGKVEEWGKVLEKHGLIEIFYPPVGKPFFKRKGKKNV